MNLHGALTTTGGRKYNPSGSSRKPIQMANTVFEASRGVVVARPRLPLSQWKAQALSSSSSKPSPPTITAGDSGFVVFIIETLTSHYHSRRLRLCRLRHRNPHLPLSQQETQALLSSSSKPSPPTITAGDSDFVIFIIETLTSHYHSRRLRLCRLRHPNPHLPLSQQETQTLSSSSSKPSPPTITAGDSGFVVIIIETITSHHHSRRLRLCHLRHRNPHLPLSQQETQALSSSSSKLSPPTITAGDSGFVVFVIQTLTSHHHSRRLRLCRLHHRNPHLPLSQKETQALSSSSSKPSPPTITEGDSGFVVFVIETLTSHYHSSHYHSRRLRLGRLRRRNCPTTYTK